MVWFRLAIPLFLSRVDGAPTSQCGDQGLVSGSFIQTKLLARQVADESSLPSDTPRESLLADPPTPAPTPSLQQYVANWRDSFNTQGWSEADGPIMGIFRASCEELSCLHEVLYVEVSLDVCSTENWFTTFDHSGMHVCPDGKFLKGIWRSSCNGLYCIDGVKCCRQKGFTTYTGICTTAVWSSFDREGYSYCPQGHAIAGLERSSCNELGCLQAVNCCPYGLPVPTPAPTAAHLPKHVANWKDKFSSKGWGTAGGPIVGIFRESCEELSCLHGVTYVSVSVARCEVLNWKTEFDVNGMHFCPDGKFLTGIWRNRCDRLSCIDRVKCCRQKEFTTYTGSCTDVDWSSFDGEGYRYCPEGHAIAGLARSSCNQLGCLEGVKCCPYGLPVPTLAPTPAPKHVADWRDTFSSRGWSTAGGPIVGIFRESCEELSCLHEVTYVSVSVVRCEVLNWRKEFNVNGMHFCPDGTFLTGIWRNRCDRLNCIDRVKCCRQKGFTTYTGSCTDVDWSSFDSKGYRYCPEGHAIAGLARSSCNQLGCLEKVKCCPYNPKPSARS